MSERAQKPIVIFRGDNTAAFDLRTITILLTGDLDLSHATAKFTLLNFTKSWTTEEVATGELSIVFDSAQTKAFALGPQTGTLRLFDMSTGTPRQLTVVNKIPFFVTNNVCEIDSQSYGVNVRVTSGDVINIEFKVGAGAVEGKADKVTNATAGDLAGLNAEGNLIDSGIPANDVQRKLTFDDTPTEGSHNPVTSDGIKQAIDAATPEDYAQVKSQVEQNTNDIATNTENISKNAGDIADNARDISANTSDISAIEAKIPAQASAQNQLADKDFVNSSIATNTATFRGSYNLVSDLGLTVSATEQQVAAAIATKLASLVPPVVPENNDYCFVQVPKTDAEPTVIERIDRYKCTVTESGGVTTRVWDYEWSLNNSSFTADQWAAINSGITSGDVAKLGALPTAQELAASLLAKYEKPSTGIPKTDLSSGVQASLDKADTALQTAPVSSVNGKTGAVSLTASDVGAVPTTRKVNNKALSEDVSLTASDVGALGNTGYQKMNGTLEIMGGGSSVPTLIEAGRIVMDSDSVGRATIDIPYRPTTADTFALLSDIYAAVQQIAPAFTAKSYVWNDLCTYNGVVYRCNELYVATSSSPKPDSDTRHWEAKKVNELFLPLTGGTMEGEILFRDGNLAEEYDHLRKWYLASRLGELKLTTTDGHTILFPVASGTLALLSDTMRFSTEVSYAVGDVVFYNGAFYHCTTEHTADAWNASHFAEVIGGLSTGTPTAPTPASGDDSTKIATTKFVQAAVAGATPNLDYVMRVNPETGEIYYTTPDANANA